MTTELKSLLERRNALNKQIHDFKDGFSYQGQINSYGCNRKVSYNNIVAVLDDASLFNGDNGHMDIKTNNPELLEHEGDGLEVTVS